MSLAIAAGLGLGGNESYPDLFQPYGGFPDGVKVVEQVFVITHEGELKQVNAARIYQLERDKDNNGHTKVVEP